MSKKLTIVFGVILTVFVSSVLAQPYIEVNMVGYLQNDTKIAIMQSDSSASGSFYVKRDSDDTTVYTGTIGNDRGGESFNHSYELDFSSFGPSAGGPYYLEVGSTESERFYISSTGYAQVVKKILKFYKSQRCGDWDPEIHGACHEHDANARIDGGGSTHDASGGWHDAGDYLKFVVTTSYAAYSLLFTYEFMDEHFLEANVNNAFGDSYSVTSSGGTSGANSIPDICDEARVGLEWLLKMTSGSYYFQVGSRADHEGSAVGCGNMNVWRWPESDDNCSDCCEDITQRVVHEDFGKNLAGKCMAAFALAYKIWNDNGWDSSFANTCRSRSQSIKNDLSSITENCKDTTDNYYEENTYQDDVAIGLIEMYRNGDATQSEAENAVNGLWDSEPIGWGSMEFFAYYRARKEGFGNNIDQKMNNILSGPDNNMDSDIFYQGASYPSWGSTPRFMGLAAGALMYRHRRASLDDRYYMLAVNERDFIYGRNQWGASFVVGVGEDGPDGTDDDPEDMASFLDYVYSSKIVGAVVGGPTLFQYESDRPSSDEYEDFHTKARDNVIYFDYRYSYIVNEPSIDYAAMTMFVTAYFACYQVDPKPQITITSPSRNALAGSVNINAMISCPSTVNSAEYRIDSGSWTTMTTSGSGPYTASATHSFTSADVGDRTVWVRAHNTAGHWGTNSIVVTIYTQDSSQVMQLTDPIIDDFEDGDVVNNNPFMQYSYAMSYSDPPATASSVDISNIAGGPSGSTRCGRYYGSATDSSGHYAGFSFEEPFGDDPMKIEQRMDIRTATHLRFDIRSDATFPSGVQMYVKLILNTNSAGGKNNDDDYKHNITANISSSWQTITIPLSNTATGFQSEGWGPPLSWEANQTNVGGITFAVETSGGGSDSLSMSHFDIDNIQILGTAYMFGVGGPPTLMIYWPTNNYQMSDIESVECFATAAGGLDSDHVQVRWDSSSTWSNLYPKSSTEWSNLLDTRIIANGAHTLSFRAEDTNSGKAVTNTINVTVQNSVTPDIDFHWPSTNGQTWSGSDPMEIGIYTNGIDIVTGTAEFRLSGWSPPSRWDSLIYVNHDSGAYIFSNLLNVTTVPNGNQTLLVRVQDANGTNYINSLPIKVRNIPSLDVYDPSSNAVLQGLADISAGVYTNGATVNYVAARIDNNPWFNLVYASNVPDGKDYTNTLSTAAYSNGPHTFIAKVNYGTSEEISTTLPIFISNVISAEFYYPTNGSKLSDVNIVQVAFWTNGGAPATMHYRVDTGAWSNLSFVSNDLANGGVIYSNILDARSLSSGSHTLFLELIDSNSKVATQTINISVDKPPRVVSVLSPGAGTTNSGNINIQAYITDDNSVISADYQVDSGSWLPLSGTPSTGGMWTATLDSTTYSDGIHTIYIRGIDVLTAEGTNSVSGIVFDNTGPVISGIAPNAGSGSQSGTINIVSIITDGLAYVNIAQYQIDNNGWQVLGGSEPNYAANNVDISSLNNGSHTLYIRAQDTQSIWATNNATFTVANNAAPVITTVSPTPGSTVSGTANIDATVTDDSGVTGVTVTIDGGSAQTMTLSSGGATSGTWRYSWNTTSIGNGSHAIIIRAVDGGSLNDTTNYTLVVNNGGIVINITSPSAGYVSGSESITAGITYSAGSITTAGYRIGNGSWANLPNTGGSSYSTIWNTTSTSDGATTVYVRAQNNVGAWATNSVAVTIDNTAPTIVISSPSAGTVSGSVAINASSSSDSGSGLVTPLQYRIDGGGSWVNLSSGGTGTWNTTSVVDGSHILYVRGSDNVGLSATNSVTVTVQNTAVNIAPVVQSIIGPTAGTYSKNVAISALITDDTSVQSAFYRVDSGSWTALGGTPSASGTWSGTINSTTYADGTHTIYVRGVDGGVPALAHTNSVSGVVFDNSGPVITAITPNLTSGGQTGTINISANINDVLSSVISAEYRFRGGSWTNSWTSLDGSEPNYSKNSVSISSLGNGGYHLDIRGQDSQGIWVTNLTTQFIVSNGGNQPPVVSMTAPTNNAIISGSVLVSANISDSDGTVQSARYRIGTGSWSSMTRTSGTSSAGTWTATWNSTSVADGSHTITVEATDNNLGTDTDSVTISVLNNPVNNPPVVTISQPTAGTHTGSVNVSAFITDDTSVQSAFYRVDSGAWVALSGTPGASGTWSGTINSTTYADGTHTIYVRGVDGGSLAGTNSVSGIIFDNHGPVITAIAPNNGSGNQSGTINITANINDVISGISMAQYQVDNLGWNALSGSEPNYSANGVNISALSDGSHTLYIRARDTRNIWTTNNTVFTVGTGGSTTTNTNVPTFDITAPKTGEEIENGLLEIKAYITGNGNALNNYGFEFAVMTGTNHPTSYDWDMMKLSGDEASAYAIIPSDDGNESYTVYIRVNGDNATIQSVSVKLKIEKCGIDPVITVGPQARFVINVLEDKCEYIEIAVYTIDGRVVMKREQVFKSKEFLFPESTDDNIANGVYLIVGHLPDGTVDVHKVMICPTGKKDD